jgi:hypothetical protein
MVISRPYEVRFRERASELFPELRSVVPQVRANGKTDLVLDTNELNIPIALHGAARHIVFIERSRSDGLEVYPRDHAIQRLEETIKDGDYQTRSEQRKTFAHLGGLPIWKLRYSDRDRAERTLRSLLDGES